MNTMKQIFYYIGRKRFSFFIPLYIIIFLLIELTKADKYVIEKQEDFINVTCNDNDSTIIINGNIELNKNITLTSHKTCNIYIKGNDPKNSVINFSESSLEFQFYNIKDVVIENLTINGNINFDGQNNIKINNVNHNGLLNTKNLKLDTNIQINQYNYNENLKDTLTKTIKFNGGNVIIENSYFYGEKILDKPLVDYEGLENGNNEIKIINCKFNCEYSSSGIHVNRGNFTLQSSYFSNGYSTSNGGFISIKYSNVYIKNCTMENGISYKSGGVFDSYNNYYFEAIDINVYNTTSKEYGSFFNENSNDSLNNIIYLSRIKHINLWNKGFTYGEGIIIKNVSNSKIYLSDFYGEGFYCPHSSCKLFFIMNRSELSIINTNINKICGNGKGGLIIHSNAYNKSSTIINIYNSTFTNIEQNSEIDSAIIAHSEGLLINIKDSFFGNIYSNISHIIYLDKGSLIMKNVEIKNFYTKESTQGINTNSETDCKCDNVTITNIFLGGELFKSTSNSFDINNLKVIGYNDCPNNDDNCLAIQKKFMNNKESVLLRIYEKNKIIINNVVLKNIYLNTLFEYGYKTEIDIDNINVENGHFSTSAISCSFNEPHRIGNIIMRNSLFNNIYATNGPFLNIDLPNNNFDNKIQFINVIIQNTVAEKYGGAIYSSSEFARYVVFFDNCIFINNTASMGTISHAYSINSEPHISNKDSLIKKYGNSAFSTNPTQLFQYKGENSLSLMSGNVINNLHFSLKDDYDNIFDFGSDYDNIKIDDLVFFKIYTNDGLNTALYGHTSGYCWEKNCELSNIRFIGNPGNYILYLKITRFGKFLPFKNNTGSVKVNVQECDNTTYRSQFRENNNIKSCYIPYCYQACNNGICVNDDVCDCSKTLFTGKYCNEHYKLGEEKAYNVLLMIGSVLIIILCIGFMIYIIVMRNNEVIKAASIDFLIIILIGNIIYCLHVLSIVFTRSRTTCIYITLFKNLGFSLIYGSIMVKSLRIYKIFKITKIGVMTKKEMYIIVFGLAFIHLSLLFFFIIFGFFKVEIKYTKKEEEYVNCKITNLELLTEFINLIVMVISSLISYRIRYIKKEFTESLAVPVYIYLLIENIIIITNAMEEMSLLFKDFIHVCGSYISSITVLYFIYYSKVQTISFKNKEIQSTQSSLQTSPLEGNGIYKKNQLNDLEIIMYNNIYKTIEDKKLQDNS